MLAMDWTNPDKLRAALKAYRAKHDLTREEFSEASGLNKWWIEKFEQGVIVEPKTARAKQLGALISKRKPAA